MRMLVLDNVNYKRCALLLYSLQIASSNLKAFMAEHPKPELAQGEQAQPKLAGGERGKKLQGKDGDEPSLAEFLLGMLAKGENEDPNAPPPRIRSREDYYAAVKQRHRPGGLSAETPAP
jgi:hypothetical protein